MVSKGRSHRNLGKNTNKNNKGMFNSSLIKSKITKAKQINQSNERDINMKTID